MMASGRTEQRRIAGEGAQDGLGNRRVKVSSQIGQHDVQGDSGLRPRGYFEECIPIKISALLCNGPRVGYPSEAGAAQETRGVPTDVKQRVSGRQDVR